MRRKAVSPLFAGVLYIAMTIMAITIVVNIGTPTITKMTDIAAIDQAKDTIVNLDKIIQEVASEGKGSTRIIPIQFKEGDIVVSASKDKIYYELDTTAEAISPGTLLKMGNVVFSGGANVNVGEGTYAGEASYILNNSHLNLSIKKIGSASDYQPMNTSELINQLVFLDTGDVFDGTISINIDNDPTQSNGTGYTYVEEIGTELGRGNVIAHMLSNAGSSYDIHFTLSSGGDFIGIEVKDYRVP